MGGLSLGADEMLGLEEDPELAPAPAPAPAPSLTPAPARASKRTASKRGVGPPKRLSLEVAGAAGRWKTPRAAAMAPPAPTPMTNEMSTVLGGQELVVGDEIEALGAAPGGDGRVWFRAKVVALRSRYPPLHVKYTATLEGVTIRLALPEPVTAYVDADGVRRITN